MDFDFLENFTFGNVQNSQKFKIRSCSNASTIQIITILTDVEVAVSRNCSEMYFGLEITDQKTENKSAYQA